MNPAERVAWLRLARTPSVGPVLFRDLIARFGSAERAVAGLPRIASKTGGGPKLADLSVIEAEIEAGERLGCHLVLSADDAFPPLLQALDPPPPAVWVRGEAVLISRRAVAVVGARTGSAAGQRFARTLARDLGAAGFVVVSGLARGIDAAAHEGSLATGSIAVLAGGVDDVFPPENADLYDRLIARGGAVMSERPMGARAMAKDFVRRNRLISGLCLGVVVVEAELRSGSLTTARLAVEQNREVFAVPGSPLDPRARGTNDLIRQGAVLCEGIEDVLRALDLPLTLARPSPRPFPEHAPVGDDEADSLREKVRALLSLTPVPRDEIVRLTGAPAAAVNGALMELALAGEAELHPGGTATAAS